MGDDNDTLLAQRIIHQVSIASSADDFVFAPLAGSLTPTRTHSSHKAQNCSARPPQTPLEIAREELRKSYGLDVPNPLSDGQATYSTYTCMLPVAPLGEQSEDRHFAW